MINNKVIVFLILCCIREHGSIPTHWLVTESGLVKPWLDAPFEQERPFDLMAFLNQVVRWEKIITFYHDLTKRHQLIDKLWSTLERDSDVGKHVKANKNCLKSESLKLVNWYIFYLQKGVSEKLSEDDFLFNLIDLQNVDQSADVPDCKKISSLTFSMIAYDHLESIKNRNNLTMAPEYTLLEVIPQMISSKHLGHWALNVLKRNSSSWLHYKMATLYWMIKGNAPKAVECTRRAVHYVPRHNKDLALLLLGSVLQRTKSRQDAITVLNAAVDHNPNHHINHFILANAYALNGDFNESYIHYNKSLTIHPEFKLAIKHRNAVTCIDSFYEKLMNVKDTLKTLINELEEFGEQEAEWLQVQAQFLKARRHDEDFDVRNINLHCEKMTKLTGLDMVNLKKEADRISLKYYFFDRQMYAAQWAEMKGVKIIDSAYSLQRLIKHIEEHLSDNAQRLLTDQSLVKNMKVPGQLADGILEIPKAAAGNMEYPSVTPTVENQTVRPKKGEKLEYETGIIRYPPNMKVSRYVEDFDKEPSWPNELFCLEKATTFPANVEAIYPVFLPFENKGIKLTHLLTLKIGVSVTKEHDLPWHPPICPQDKDVLHLTSKKPTKVLHLEIIVMDSLRLHLLQYVGDGDSYAATHMQDAEIGQRIYAAMKKGLVPKWITYTLASLYWRVRSNNINALQCLVAASKAVPNRFRDVVFTSMGSVYLEMGYFDEALAAVEESFRLSPYEPATNFVLAELNMIKKHRNTQLFHIKQVVRVDSNFLDGVGRNLLDAWMCLLKQIHEHLDYAKEDICTPVEPGLNMVCEKEGVNCHMTNKKCKNKEKSDSFLVKMLRQGDDKDAEIETADEIFDTYISNMPRDSKNVEGHRKHYKAMMKRIQTASQGCGPLGCETVAPNNMGLLEDDCRYQLLQLGYWIHMVSFKEMQADNDIRLPAEITKLPTSTEKLPECRLDIDPKLDFFLDKIIKVDTTEWEPTVSVMQQLAEMLNYFDYTSLGTKIAKYIDMKPSSWVGALGAGWWCGAGGRAACAVRCLASAYSLAPATLAPHALRALVALLHLNSKPNDAKEIAYLSFYTAPKSKVDAFLVAVSHSYLDEHDKAIWMYRYSMSFDDDFLASKACLHATRCLMLFESAKEIPQQVD